MSRAAIETTASPLAIFEALTWLSSYVGDPFERKRGRCPMLDCYQSPRTFCRAQSRLIFRKYFSCLNCEDAGEAGAILQHQRGENRTSLPRIVVIDDMKSRSANWGSVLKNLDGVGTGTVRVHYGRPGQGLVSNSAVEASSLTAREVAGRVLAESTCCCYRPQSRYGSVRGKS